MVSPYEAPNQDAGHPGTTEAVGPVRSSLGILLCLFSLSVLAYLAFRLVFLRAWGGMATFGVLLGGSNVAGAIAGWRLGGRRSAGAWLWVWVVPHLLLVGLLLVVFVFSDR